MQEIKFSGCTVRIFPEDRYLETVFPDGSIVPAAPQDNEEYRRTARELGYGEDTWRMCVHHELLHSVYAEATGRPHSEILRCVADGVKGDWQEESIVMQLQKRLMELWNL